MEFIPANESRWFIRFFRVYVKILFKRRFKRIWLRQEYEPIESSRTVYYLNHNSWWDGLIPLMLNEYRFRQQARALMEDKQMKDFPFFSRIGAFSINRSDSRSAVTSLRYAVNSMQRPNASLFIYPEGKLHPAGTKPIFEDGLAWLYRKLPEADFVPVGIYAHTLRHDKPELHLHVAQPAEFESDCSTNKLSRLLEQELHNVLVQLRKTAGFDDSLYERFL